ncbi:Uncharacterized protein HZ326_18182 [Fusarium oxysporum f. sp. albedinis]|nr:Uncharacterized protein HZ326_18182 [Fusarium oxysporum f. sp. albedinis]
MSGLPKTVDGLSLPNQSIRGLAADTRVSGWEARVECGEGCHTETPHISPAISNPYPDLACEFRLDAAISQQRDEMTCRGLLFLDQGPNMPARYFDATKRGRQKVPFALHHGGWGNTNGTCSALVHSL